MVNAYGYKCLDYIEERNFNLLNLSNRNNLVIAIKIQFQGWIALYRIQPQYLGLTKQESIKQTIHNTKKRDPKYRSLLQLKFVRIFYAISFKAAIFASLSTSLVNESLLSKSTKIGDATKIDE